jgi:hypothetical protein
MEIRFDSCQNTLSFQLNWRESNQAGSGAGDQDWRQPGWNKPICSIKKGGN